MGSPLDETGRYGDEGPQHEVHLTEFKMGRTPITQAQWRAVAALPKFDLELKPEPSFFKGDNLPVERVSWFDAMEFCRRLSQHTGRHYTLPTEAQWEYACRAGTTTPFHFGETIRPQLANYDSEEGVGTTKVGIFPANDWGLQDMHGNVWEWCLDHWHENYEGAPEDGSAWLGNPEKKFCAADPGSATLGAAAPPVGTTSGLTMSSTALGSACSVDVDRVLRGGSWFNDPVICRSACRILNHPADALSNIGFRVCSPPQNGRAPEWAESADKAISFLLEASCRAADSGHSRAAGMLHLAANLLGDIRQEDDDCRDGEVTA
jgi:formylglycine-generating enzyme required for sulfatase activity